MINLFLGSVTLLALGFLSGCFYCYIRQHKIEVSASLLSVKNELVSIHAKFDKLLASVIK